MSEFRKRSLLAAAAISTLAFATSALAQAPSAELSEVVVTAERRSENLQKVPVSVAVISAEQVRAASAGGDDTLISLSGKAPSFYAETTTGRIFPRFYIRGLGNIDFYLGASQPVSIIQDDVVLEHVVLKSNPVFDVQQVEVLRGPQGSLFGRNTTAGIVKFDTIRPSDTLQGRAQATYGSYNTMTFDGGIGGPIAPGAAFRLSALYQHRDDWVDNTFAGASADGTITPKKNTMGGFDEKDLRAQLLLHPGEQMTVLMSAHARDYRGTSTLFLRNALTKGSNKPNAARDKVAFDEAQNNPQAYKTYGTSLNVAYDFGPVTLTSISAYETSDGYSRGDTDGGAAANFGGIGFGQSMGQLRDLDQYSQELRLSSNGAGRFKWQAGGMVFDSEDLTDFYQRGYFLTPGTAGYNPNNYVRLRNLNTSWAVFGQASYQVTDALTITAGARQTEDTKKTKLLQTANTAAGAVTYTGRRYVRLSDSKPSFDLSALYQVNPDLSVYARVATGFRGPTIQGRSAVFNADFTTANSETITSYEAGFKSTLLDNRLRLNATAFAYNVKDIQLNGNDSNGNGVLFNADKAKAYGFEADADWRPIENLTLSGGFSYLHTEINDKRVYAQVCALNGVIVCTVQNPTIRVGANVFAQIDGQPLPNAPKYNVSFAGRYDIPVSAEGRIFLATDWNMQGYTNFVLYKTPEFTAKGNFEGGARIGYEGGNGAYEVALFARNITNEKNLKGVIENYMAAVYNEPRIVGVSLSAKLR